MRSGDAGPEVVARSMRSLPRPEIKPTFSASAGVFLTTGRPGKSLISILKLINSVVLVSGTEKATQLYIYIYSFSNSFPV